MEGRNRIGKNETKFGFEYSDATASTQIQNRARERLVTDAAYDAGGLLRQWLGDFFSALRSYSLPLNGLNVYVDKGISNGVSSSSLTGGDSYIACFISNGNAYLPPAIYMDNRYTQPFSFESCAFNEEGLNCGDNSANASSRVLGEHIRSSKKSSKAIGDTVAFIKSLYCTVGKAINQVIFK